MKIFVQEFASGGGLSEDNLHPTLLLEGFAILRSITHYFKSSGFEVITTLDYRLEQLASYLTTDMISLVPKEKSDIKIGLELLKNCDYFLVIAPGSDGILSKYIEKYSETSAQSLNCSIETIEIATQKHRSYRLCSTLGINIPTTFKIHRNGLCSNVIDDSLNLVQMRTLFSGNILSFPTILKPDEGVACEGLVLLTNLEDLEEYLQGSSSEKILIQEYIDGEHISVTMYVTKEHNQLLSINKQSISFDKKHSDYLGGVVNIDHPLAKEIEQLSDQIISNIPGLFGFIGIDYIICNNKIYFIELNPRATTPVSVLLTANFYPNNQHRMEQVVFKRKENNKVICFAKISIDKIKENQIDLPKLKHLDYLLTPPLDFDEAMALIKGTGETIELAWKDFEKNKLHLSNKLKKD